MTLSPDLHTFTANQTRPAVGTPRKELPQFNLNDETQPKVVKPSAATTDFDMPDHVNALFVKTLEDVDLPDKTANDLKLLLRDHQGTLVRKMSDENVIRRVVPRRFRKSFFDATQSGPLAAHLGSQRTFL